MAALIIIKILFAFVDHACSSSFWKKVEPIFASVSLQDRLDVSGQVVTRICNVGFICLFSNGLSDSLHSFMLICIN